MGANTPSSAHPFPHEQQPRRSPTGQKTRVLVLVQDTLVTCGRARAREGQGGAWTERERRPLNEASCSCWWCPRTPGASYFEAGHVLHLLGHLQPHTDEVCRRYGVLCPLLPCELDRGAIIIACICVRTSCVLYRYGAGLDSNQIVPVQSFCIERSVTFGRYSKSGRYLRWSRG